MRESPTKEIELKFFKSHNFIIGVDEVGVGCLAGPVVACACLISKEDFKRLAEIEGIGDSKLISPKKRELISKALKKEGFKFELSLSSEKVIDRVGIYRATQKAMISSIVKLIKKNGVTDPIILIDGNRSVKDLNLTQHTIIKGDRKVFSIASASIIAKVYRDLLMFKYEAKYPGYSFGVHKGYGTIKHRLAIKKLGPCPLHRKSFTLL